MVFDPDPQTSDGVFGVSPISPSLEAFRKERPLARLKGRGVLEGEYVDVRSGRCKGDYEAFSRTSVFSYRRSEPGFQEAMLYHHADTYLAEMSGRGVSAGGEILGIAHCPELDNAYFVKGTTSNGEVVRLVCLGDSTDTLGASYGDDGQVTLHEVQHGLTGETYSPSISLNVLWYDDAGSLNEGISDFFGLLMTDSKTHSSQDPRVFGRWSLGLFTGNFDGTRGAHRCPKYDETYPNCSGYAAGAAGFSVTPPRVSFAYPDGMGWRYARGNLSQNLSLRDVYERESSREEIHTNAILATGMLWDTYERLKATSGINRARTLMIDVVHEALRHLPKPSSASVSPVTYPGFARALFEWASPVGFSEPERSALSEALTQRGFSLGTGAAGQLPQSWAAVGPGISPYPGLYVEDDYRTLRSWAEGRGVSRTTIPQGIETGLNHRADPGEVIVVWFDVANTASLTAGSPELEVESLDPRVEILDTRFNDGALSISKAQIRYQKINGTEIASQLSSLSARASYFGTNPKFTRGSMTGVWMRVAAEAPGGLQVPLRVRVRPANGPLNTVTFSLAIGAAG